MTQPNSHSDPLQISLNTLDQPIVTPKKLMLNYRYQRLLGEGSNGKTYLAIDRRTGQKVAIKALKLVQNDSYKSFELFKREAETLSSIQVNGVPRFYARILANIPGEESYLIQEYIDAPSLLSYLENGRKFTEDETLVLMYKICGILNDLHTLYSPPIIHRDIKPSNILCKLPESSGLTEWAQISPYLIDFGAVANANSNSDKSTIAGTIGYMAPEQNFGECLPQTDLYALGATALHMLTGKPPYEMDYETYALKFEPYLDEFAPNTSAKTRELLRTLLSYSTDERPTSAHELQKIIEDIIETKDLPVVVEAAPSGPLARILDKLQKFYRKLGQKITPVPDPRDLISAIENDPTCAKLAYGILWPKHPMTPTYAVYTFTANGRSWAGTAEFPLSKVTSSHIPEPPFTSCKPPDPDFVPFEEIELYMYFSNRVILPTPCVVKYHPDDPSCNRLCYVYQPEQAPDSNEAPNEPQHEPLPGSMTSPYIVEQT